jgi:hypothetical protein
MAKPWERGEVEAVALAVRDGKGFDEVGLEHGISGLAVRALLERVWNAEGVGYACPWGDECMEISEYGGDVPPPPSFWGHSQKHLAASPNWAQRTG